MKYIYRINEIKTEIDFSVDELARKAEKKSGLKPGDLGPEESPGRKGIFVIRRQSVDARDKSHIHYVFALDITTDSPLRRFDRKKVRQITGEGLPDVKPGNEKLRERPVIAGFGPCGIFCALRLARAGYKPVVIERGSVMDKRIADVGAFHREGCLDPESNVLFGEGGAGTFSDGKLNSGISDGHVRQVLETFRDAGADPDITYRNKPHIGTDVLRKVVVNLRKKIISLGGEIRFDTRLTDIVVENGRLSAVKVQNKEGENLEIPATVLVLAIGHSARDTFKMARDRGLPMEQKPFSIGVRMEHPQEMIDRSQYGEERRLPPADYKLSYKASNGRGVYSFCMCPGGQVIPCASEPGMLCVNGMSNRKRDSGTANSGILCDVRTEDFGSDDVLAGVEFQRKYERLCFQNGGGNYKPPKSTMKEFLENTGDGSVVINTLPEFAADAIREAVPFFAKKIKGYDRDDGVVTAVETRSSSPVRILREKSMESQVGGIYPAGEGAGYAGGITSAACDGIKVAEKIIARYHLVTNEEVGKEK